VMIVDIVCWSFGSLPRRFSSIYYNKLVLEPQTLLDFSERRARMTTQLWLTLVVVLGGPSTYLWFLVLLRVFPNYYWWLLIDWWTFSWKELTPSSCECDLIVFMAIGKIVWHYACRVKTVLTFVIRLAGFYPWEGPVRKGMGRRDTT
jgi:hypothetical protein